MVGVLSMVDHELITLLAHEELDIDTALRGCRDGTQQACIAGRKVTLVAIMRTVWRFAAPNGSMRPE